MITVHDALDGSQKVTEHECYLELEVLARLGSSEGQVLDVGLLDYPIVYLLRLMEVFDMSVLARVK